MTNFSQHTLLHQQNTKTQLGNIADNIIRCDIFLVCTDCNHMLSSLLVKILSAQKTKQKIKAKNCALQIIIVEVFLPHLT